MPDLENGSPGFRMQNEKYLPLDNSSMVERLWTEVVQEWRPRSETKFLRYSGFCLPLLSVLPATEVGKLYLILLMSYLISGTYQILLCL